MLIPVNGHTAIHAGCVVSMSIGQAPPGGVEAVFKLEDGSYHHTEPMTPGDLTSYLREIWGLHPVPKRYDDGVVVPQFQF